MTEQTPAPQPEPAEDASVTPQQFAEPAQDTPQSPSAPATEPAALAAEVSAADEAATEPASEPAADEPATEPAADEPAAPSADEPAAPAAPRPVPTPAMVAKAVKPAAPAVPATPGNPVAPAPALPAGHPAAPGAGEVETTIDPAEFAAASRFGRVAPDGTVSLLEAAGERVVGQYPDVSEEEALGLYIRRYLDLEAQVTLFATRLEQLSARDLDAGLESLTEALAEPAVVGDVDALRARVDELRTRVSERKEALAAEREAARARALEIRTDIVERAEALAALDPKKVQWRAHGEQLRGLLDEWKSAQRSGARLDRGTEDGLWKRFSAARSTFDRNRRQYFAELDRRHAQVKEVKEGLIARAEELSTSTDWGPTSAAMRSLMDSWKAAGRASRRDDDALWARFRAAQDTFYQARQAQNEATDAEYQANLEVKLSILAEAEKLLPVSDIKAAKAALRGLQDRWEEAGRVPRDQLKSTEARMRAVEQAIRDAEDAQWKRQNPRVRARAEGAAAQLEAAIADLRADLEKARAGGDERRIRRAEEALSAREAWLEQVLRAAEDAR